MGTWSVTWPFTTYSPEPTFATITTSFATIATSTKSSWLRLHPANEQGKLRGESIRRMPLVHVRCRDVHDEIDALPWKRSGVSMRYVDSLSSHERDPWEPLDSVSTACHM